MRYATRIGFALIVTRDSEALTPIQEAMVTNDGKAAGVACKPAALPMGEHTDARLIALWRAGYDAGKSERIAKLKASRLIGKPPTEFEEHGGDDS